MQLWVKLEAKGFHFLPGSVFFPMPRSIVFSCLFSRIGKLLDIACLLPGMLVSEGETSTPSMAKVDGDAV